MFLKCRLFVQNIQIQELSDSLCFAMRNSYLFYKCLKIKKEFKGIADQAFLYRIINLQNFDIKVSFFN